MLIAAAATHAGRELPGGRRGLSRPIAPPPAGKKVRALSSGWLSRALVATLNSGMKLRICRSQLSWATVGTLCLFKIIPAGWRDYALRSGLYSNSSFFAADISTVYL